MAVPYYETTGQDIENETSYDLSGFDLKNFTSSFGEFDIPINEKNIEGGVIKIIPSLVKAFKTKFKRDPSQDELAAAFNKINPHGILSREKAQLEKEAEDQNFSYTKGKQSYVQRNMRGAFASPDKIFETLNRQSDISDSMQRIAPRIREIEIAERQLGTKLPNDIRYNVLSSEDIEGSQREIASFISGEEERQVGSFLEGLPAQQEREIDELEQSLVKGQRRALEEQFYPVLQGAYGARQLLQRGELVPESAGQVAQKLQSAGIPFSGGDLASSLSEIAGRLGKERESYIAPLRAETKLGGLKSKYENVLRGALESGRSLSDATAFARNLFAQQQSQQFQSGQANLGRQFQNEQQRQKMAYQLALTGQQRSPSGLDYFLKYGLPTLTSLGSAYIGR